MRGKKIDKFFLSVVLLLNLIGVAMFVSASLGVLAKNEKIFVSVLISQLGLGLGLGLLGMYIALKLDYKIWRRFSIFIFIAAVLLTAAVFIPNLGWSHGGAQRWLKVGPVSMQPVEVLKFSFIIFFAAWLSWVQNKKSHLRWRILPYIGILALVGAILLNQPDTKSLILIMTTGAAMLFIAGVSFRYLLGLGLITVVAFAALVYFTPYLRERVETYIDPSSDPRGSSYQIQQSLIAIGSGGIFGRGFGQSIQKFSYLPEPQGDSIFAVLGEELGFVGAVGAILLYLVFALRGFRIANNSPDLFSRLLVSGIVILIIVQSFMHIASNVGVFPLTGVPLVFMSQGGTSFMIDLVAVGIVLQVSRYRRKN